LKGLNAISATTTSKATPRDAGRRSRNTPSPIADGFALSGPSNLPDPAFHAYRQDLADAALAGLVIASHYAEPLPRKLKSEARLAASPSDDGEMIATLSEGDDFALLDSIRGWAWGYAGPKRRVGYVRAEAVG
jgi:hypothetical protein